MENHIKIQESENAITEEKNLLLKQALRLIKLSERPGVAEIMHVQ